MTVTIPSVGLTDSTTLVIASEEDPHRELIAEFHEICKMEFEEGSDLEPLSVWQDNIQRHYCDYTMNFVFIVDTAGGRNRVLGGAVVEVYAKPLCSLVGYFAVAPEYRGKGAARRLMRAAFALSTNICRHRFNGQLNAMFIEVIHPQDAAHCKGDFDAATRQRIWAKLGFTPLDCLFVVPGTVIHKARYQWALWSEKYPHDTATEFPSEIVFSFLDEIFTDILACEGKAGERAEIEEYGKSLLAAPTIRIGQQYWVK